VQIHLAGIAEGDFGLPFVDPPAGAVAIVIPVAGHVLGAVGQAAALAARIERVGTFVPTAQVFFRVAPLGLLPALNLGLLAGLGPDLHLVYARAQAADRGLDVAVPVTEVAATNHALGRRRSETNSYRTFATKGHR